MAIKGFRLVGRVWFGDRAVATHAPIKCYNLVISARRNKRKNRVSQSIMRNTTRRKSMTAPPFLVRGFTESVWFPAGRFTSPIVRKIMF